ncbi:MAG: EthD domain-containing protein [Actinobacteria bacterium]|nr:EthD domain-containing protein [Actinomycetota bacterium]
MRKLVAFLPSAPAEMSGLERSLDDDAAVLFAWLNDGDALPALPPDAHAWEVAEGAQWDDRPVGAPAGVKRVVFINRLPTIGRNQFARHWADGHAPLARKHHPALWRYVQNVVVAPLTADAPDIDGIAELSFASVNDMHERMYDSDEGREIISADVATFIDLGSGSRVVVAEPARVVVAEAPR